MNDSRHVSALDGVRGAAIVMVLAHHFTVDVRNAGPVGQFALGVLSGGWAGVDLFFVLSGFLITGILLDAKGSPYYFRNFYMRRALRIFPLYFGVLAATVLVGTIWFRHSEHFAALLDNQVWLWCYASNVLTTLHNGWVMNTDWMMFSSFWSLCIEEHFYLVWPLVVFLLSRRFLPWVCIALIVLAVASRCVLRYAFDCPYGAYEFTTCRMDGLAVGALLALVVRGDAAWVLRWVAPVAVASCLGVAALFVWQNMRLWSIDPTSQIAGHTLLVLAFGWLVLACGRAGVVATAMSNPVLRSFGKYSYALYAFQAFAARPLLLLLPLSAFDSTVGHTLPAAFLRMAVCVGCLYMMAWVSWHAYEKHWLKLKQFFPRGQAADAKLADSESLPAVAKTPTVCGLEQAAL